MYVPSNMFNQQESSSHPEIFYRECIVAGQQDSYWIELSYGKQYLFMVQLDPTGTESASTDAFPIVNFQALYLIIRCKKLDIQY